MKKIKMWEDVQFIIIHKLDVRSPDKKLIQYVSFLRYSLFDILGIIDDGRYEYDNQL